MRDETHVIGVDCAERCQAVTHYGKERDEDVVDNVDDVVTASTNANPAFRAAISFWLGLPGARTYQLGRAPI